MPSKRIRSAIIWFSIASALLCAYLTLTGPVITPPDPLDDQGDEIVRKSPPEIQQTAEYLLTNPNPTPSDERWFVGDDHSGLEACYDIVGAHDYVWSRFVLNGGLLSCVLDMSAGHFELSDLSMYRKTCSGILFGDYSYYDLIPGVHLLRFELLDDPSGDDPIWTYEFAFEFPSPTPVGN